MAEMFLRAPLFPGSDYRSQISTIFSVLGTPSEQDQRMTMSKRARSYIKTFPKSSYILDTFMSGSSAVVDVQSLDMIEGLLTYNPAKRLSVNDSLEHIFVRRYHDSTDEPEAKSVELGLNRHQVDYETADITALKRELYDLIKKLN